MGDIAEGGAVDVVGVQMVQVRQERPYDAFGNSVLQ